MQKSYFSFRLAINVDKLVVIVALGLELHNELLVMARNESCRKDPRILPRNFD